MENKTEIDLFADESFNVVAWLNGVIEGSGSQANGNAHGEATDTGLQSHLTGVVTRLQILSGEMNQDLEKNMVEIMAAVPRTMHEVNRIEASVRGLAGSLQLLLEQLEDIDQGTNTHVELLAQLDLVKSNMQDCMATLTEAANWNQLVRDAHGRLAAGDLSGVAERLEALRRSMAVLQNMPEAAGRSATLAQLQDQLEELIKPRLTQALQKERVAPLSEFVEIFGRLGKLEQLQLEYTRARPAAAHRHWFAWGGAAQEPFATWLPSFFEQVIGLVTDERRRAAELFGHDAASGVLSQLLLHTFEPIAGSFLERLNDRSSLPWPAAVDLYPDTLSFLAQALEQLGGAGQSPLLAVLLTVTAPFQDMQDRFFQRERQHLREEFAAPLACLAAAAAAPSAAGGKGG
ncbi:unnamed protein product, partial [Phaeothamnion confervicola]